MKRLAAILGLTAMLVLGGCGGDDNGGGGSFQPPPTVIDVKAGTWRLAANINLAACGAPSISLTPPPEPVCDGLDIDGFLAAYNFDCDVTVSGNTIRISCTGLFLDGDCAYDVAITGTGNMTGAKDAIAVSGTFTLTLKTGDPRQCDFGSGCTGPFSLNANWLMSEPCTENAAVALTGDQLGRFLMGPMFGGTTTP